jgi:hypothetical protein
MSKPKSFHACRVERIQHVTHGTLNLVSGAQTSDRTEIVTEPCNVPLFSDKERQVGVCRSCLSGWQVEENKPTETGLKLIASVKG